MSRTSSTSSSSTVVLGVDGAQDVAVGADDLLEGVDDGQGLLLAGDVGADGLAGGAAFAPDAEDVVADLEGEAELAAEGVEALAVFLVARRRRGRRAASEAPSRAPDLRPIMLDVLVERDVVALLEAEVLVLAFDHLAAGVVEDAAGGEDALGGRPCSRARSSVW